MRAHPFVSVLVPAAVAAAALATTTAAAAHGEGSTEDMIAIGGYGGPLVVTTTIHDEVGMLVGGRGGVVLGRRLGLGGEGFGLVNPIDMPGTSTRIHFGGGGFWAQLDWAPDWPVQPMTGIFVGGAGVSWDGSGSVARSSSVFLVAPEIGADVPIVHFLRVGVTGQYRFASGLRMAGLGSSDFGGPAAALYVKFGKF